jgi:alpha-amylase/alpha-mannosidase (GH57 family)
MTGIVATLIAVGTTLGVGVQHGITMQPKDSNKKPLYLNIIWHQHQPMYLDPGTDQLQGPWVRTHGTKDYYDMAAMLRDYPDIHVTVNLTSSLLHQLEEYYVSRLKPFVDVKNNRVDAKKYFASQKGKTDPWIDLALKPAGKLTKTDLQYLLTDAWNAFGVSPVVLERFPEYKALKEKFQKEGTAGLQQDDLRSIIFWFYVAHFDPDFLQKRVPLVTGLTVDITDLVERHQNGTYTGRSPITETHCNRIVAETYKILSAVIPIHKKLMFDGKTGRGQIEVITTPYYHPILPLIYDSDLAKLCQPNDPMPERFTYPADAEAQVEKAVKYYQEIFGRKPTGMWPAEGSVAYDLVPVFGRSGIRWIATDEKILERSKPVGMPKYQPYIVRTGAKTEDSVVIVFRDTELSDRIGFVYQNWQGEAAAEDFIGHVLKYAPPDGQRDRLLTVILDGENAWEWFKQDEDAKTFLNSLYGKLAKLQKTKEVMTLTLSEYLAGNESRGIPAHPPDELAELEWLWPGSWINANYDTWIGEREENEAWEYLRTAREDLEKSGLPRPDYKASRPQEGTKAWYAEQAWEAVFAAEGSDWFWWYGTDQSAPAGDRPFDIAFITHLNHTYEFAYKAGAKMPERRFDPIIRTEAALARASRGTMAQSTEDLVTVVFQCDAKDVYVRKGIYITGNLEALANWRPNVVRLHDDGTNGDQSAGDGIWSLEIQVPPGTKIEYKYTNSGPAGDWEPGQEFPQLNRSHTVEKDAANRIILSDRFGKI